MQKKKKMDEDRVYCNFFVVVARERDDGRQNRSNRNPAQTRLFPPTKIKTYRNNKKKSTAATTRFELITKRAFVKIFPLKKQMEINVYI